MQELTPFTKAKVEEFKKVRTDAITIMFDNKYADGIYPTSKFYETLDAFITSALQEQKKMFSEAIERNVEEFFNYRSLREELKKKGLI